MDTGHAVVVISKPWVDEHVFADLLVDNCLQSKHRERREGVGYLGMAHQSDGPALTLGPDVWAWAQSSVRW